DLYYVLIGSHKLTSLVLQYIAQYNNILPLLAFLDKSVRKGKDCLNIVKAVFSYGIRILCNTPGYLKVLVVFQFDLSLNNDAWIPLLLSSSIFLYYNVP